MAIAIEEAHAPASQDDLARIEDVFGAPVPHDYRRFLETVGGGYTAQTTVPGTSGRGLLLHLFDATTVAWENAPDERSAGFPAYIPAVYLFVGDGGGGGLCIRVREDDIGSVWWADFDKAGEFANEEPHEEIMIRVADDFDSFLALFD